MIAALREMMSDDTKRQAFAREAVNVRDRFSMPKISENWQALIGEALGDHQPGADGRPEGKTIGGAGHS